MSTPTNHTSITSFFNEWMAEPDETQTTATTTTAGLSIDEASSIDDSNIFGDVSSSAHSRYSSYSKGGGNRSRITSTGQSLLGPLDEEEVSSSSEQVSAQQQQQQQPTLTQSSVSTSSNRSGQHENNEPLVRNVAEITSANNDTKNGILKPSRFANDSMLSVLPPPPPPPPPPCPHHTSKGSNVNTKPKATQLKHIPTTGQQEQQDENSTVATTVLGNISEDTESHFFRSFHTTNSMATNKNNIINKHNNNNNHNNNNGPLHTNASSTTTTTTTAFTTGGGGQGDPSQRTNTTFGYIPGNVASETLHTSNARTPNNYEYTVGRDADHVAAWAIHIALIFFCGLVIASAMLTFVVIRNYGFITLVGLLIVILFCGFLACFVDQTILSQNPKLRPIRQKIITVVQATKHMLQEEYHLLVRDWNEHLLLTQNGEDDNNNSYYYYQNQDGQTTTRIPPITTNQPGRKRSKLFKFIKPMLGLKKKLFRGGNRQQQRRQQQSQEQQQSSKRKIDSASINSVYSTEGQLDYEPPNHNTNNVNNTTANG